MTTYRHRLEARLLTLREVAELRRATKVATGSPADVPTTPCTPPEPAPGRLAVTWLGHSSTLLSVDGVTALVDPVLGPRIPGSRRLTPPGRTVADLPPLDVLLISHDHYDHLDRPTVQGLPRDLRVVVPMGTARWFTRRGFRDVTELDWWESVRVGTVDVELVPARHWTRRGPFDTCRRLWGGWVLTGGDGRAVLHAGDSGYGPHFTRIGARHPRIAAAVLPVGAYAPRHLLRDVHMDPAEAVRAAGDLRATAMVPVHWGTFRLSGEPLTEPVERARAEWARAGRDRADLWDLPIGGTAATPPRT